MTKWCSRSKLPCVLLTACFLESLHKSACQAGQREAADAAKVHASVYLGHQVGSPGLGLKVHMTVEGVEDDAVILDAHQVCLALASL